MTVQKPGEARALRTIRDGGKPAVARFIKTAQDRHAAGGEDELRTWIATALDELTPEDRAEMIAMLLGALFERTDKEPKASPRGDSNH